MFAILWTGAFISNIGTWMETVGVGILVTEATGQAIWTGLVAAAGFVPLAVLGPVGGALADRVPAAPAAHRHDRRSRPCSPRVLTVLAATGEPGPGIVTLIVFAAGCVQSIGFPAYQAVLPDLVPERGLVGAVALSSAQWNLGRVVGPALAGIMISVGGYEWAFAFNALSFLAVIFAVIQLRLPPPVERKRAVDLRVGPRRLRVRRAATRACASSSRTWPSTRLLAAPFIALVPAMAEKVFDAGASGTAVLVTAQGIGAVTMALSLAALAAPLRQRPGAARACSGACRPRSCVYAVMPDARARRRSRSSSSGFLYLGALSSFTSIAQLRAPAAVRGRVLSVLMVLLGSLYPLGAVMPGRDRRRDRAARDDRRRARSSCSRSSSSPGSLRPRFAAAVEAAGRPARRLRVRDRSRRPDRSSSRSALRSVPAPAEDRSWLQWSSERRDRVAIVTLNRPEARNAVNGDVANAMEAILDELEADDAIQVVVLTGAGSDVLRRRRPEEGRARARAASSPPRRAGSAGSSPATSRSRSSPRSTGPRSRAGSRSCSRATSSSRPTTRCSGSPRPSAGSSPRPAG